MDPFRDRAFAITRETERVVAVRTPREEFDSAGVGRVGADRVGERVGPVDGRVEDVKRREAFVVFEAGIDIVAAKEQSSGGNVLSNRKSSAVCFAFFSGGARAEKTTGATHARVERAVQSAPAALRILQVDRAPRNREEQLDPVEGPRVLFDDGEVQHCPAEPGRRRSVAIVVAGAILSPSAAAAAASCCCRSSSSTA